MDADPILDTAVRVFADHADAPEALWSAQEATGMTLAATPEAMGGVGLPPTSVFALIRVAGAATTSAPLAETLLAARLLSAAGIAPPEGALTLAAGGRVSGGRLEATLDEVPFSEEAAHLALLTETEDGAAVALLATADAKATPVRSIGEDPAASLRFSSIEPLVLATTPAFGPKYFRAEAALARSAQMYGAMEAALDLTLAHASTREQFGRPLAKFQAIQHMLAEVAGEIAAAGAAVDAAVETAGPLAPPDILCAAAAKIRASEAAGIVAAHAHQAHGALGYTHDYALRHHTRRLWRWREEFGDETEWAILLGRAAAAAPGAPSLRRQIFGGPDVRRRSS